MFKITIQLYNHIIIIQRKFVRDSECVPATNFYSSFREWVDVNFPVLNDNLWIDILDEDENIDYGTVGTGKGIQYNETVEEEVLDE